MLVDKRDNFGAALPFFCCLAGVVAESTTSAPRRVAATISVSLHQVGLMKVNNIMTVSPFCCLAGVTAESASSAPRQVAATVSVSLPRIGFDESDNIVTISPFFCRLAGVVAKSTVLASARCLPGIR
jgi:hypothetical protein